MPATIRIAAALILDPQGRTLLVRKHNTTAFMQAGGKIEAGETPLHALQRELLEELNLAIDAQAAHYLGRFSAPAANEPDHIVEAELFRIMVAGEITRAAEIAEIIWLTPGEPVTIPLAPLTADKILPLLKPPAPPPRAETR